MLVSFLRPGLFASLFLLVAVGLTVSLGAAGLAARADQERQRIASSFMVRVLAPASDDAVAKAAKALADAPGVRTAAPMDPARAARLLTRWGGRTLSPSDLPPLQLIEVRAAGGDVGRTTALLTETLRKAGVAAEVYDPGPAVAARPIAPQLAVMAAATVALAVFASLLFALAAAARAERTRLTLWADLGVTRSATLAAFGRAGSEIAFLAGATTMILALIVAPGVRIAAGEAISFQSMIASLSPVDVLIALSAPLLAALAGGFGARIGAGGAFDAADRLG